MLKGGILPVPEISPLIIGGYKFPIEPLVEVKGGKRLVKTEVPGRDGTVKELVGQEDYTISVNVILQGIERGTTLAELSGLVAIWEREESLLCICPKTALYGIDFVVFESISHPETEGMEATERLTLTFLSDQAMDFEMV